MLSRFTSTARVGLMRIAAPRVGQAMAKPMFLRATAPVFSRGFSGETEEAPPSLGEVVEAEMEDTVSVQCS